tara:strand:- start:917 stop:1147 length:231 start_codon:yes stop_codon:yes gene_type:complete
MSGVSDKDPWHREWRVIKSIPTCDFVVEQYYKPDDPNSSYNTNSTIKNWVDNSISVLNSEPPPYTSKWFKEKRKKG